jgi:pilus assembly protein Flp/PilA
MPPAVFRCTLYHSEGQVMRLLTALRRFVREDSGQDLLEYGMLAALIAVVVLAAVSNSGSSINNLWTAVAASMAAVP